MSDATTNMLSFPGDSGALRSRVAINESLPGLCSDPIKTLVSSGDGVFDKVMDVVVASRTHEKSADRIRKKGQQEIGTLLMLNEEYSHPRLLEDADSGRQFSVLPARFVIKFAQMLSAADNKLTADEALGLSGWVSLVFNFRNLVFDEVDPSKSLSPSSDSVTRRLVAALLCTGINDEPERCLPDKSVATYMYKFLPMRLGAAISYAAMFEKLQELGHDKDEANRVVDSFIQARMESVNGAKDGLLSVSTLDRSFANPLSREDLESFLQYSSYLREERQLRSV